MKHSTGKPTKAEQGRLDIVHASPCMACVKERVQQPLPTEAQHLVDKGTRALSGGHMATIPLCGWHHRGEPVEYMTASEMKRIYGPSLARHKREFVNVYGRERVLLEEFDERLKQDAAA